MDVQTAIAAAMPLLPPGMPSPPSFRKVNPSDSPILFLTLVSDTLPLSKLDEYAADDRSAAHLDGPGVAQVNVMGGQKFAVRVKANPDKLASHGSASTNSPTRCALECEPAGRHALGQRARMNIQATGQLWNAEEFRRDDRRVSQWRAGAPEGCRDGRRQCGRRDEPPHGCSRIGR